MDKTHRSPTLQTHAAKSIILICVGILLLSACGWTPPNPRFDPIQFEGFLLWQTTPGLPPAILGSGRVEGSPASFSAYTTIFPSACNDRRHFVLRGTNYAGSPPLDVIAHAEPWPGQPNPQLTVHLTGTVRPGRGRPSLLPLTGSMTMDDWCNGSLALNVEARPGPALKHYWHGQATTSSAPNMNLRLTLNQTNPDAAGHAWFWGELHLDPPCNAFGFLAPQIASEHSPASVIFQAQDRASVTLTNLPSSLDPDPPSELRSIVRISGGPCNGQTFPIRFTSH